MLCVFFASLGRLTTGVGERADVNGFFRRIAVNADRSGITPFQIIIAQLLPASEEFNGRCPQRNGIVSH